MLPNLTMPLLALPQDPRLPRLLESLRSSGRKLFLATNSLWDYTHVVMNFLLSGRTGADRNLDWLRYFDAVITGGVAALLRLLNLLRLLDLLVY